LRDARGAGPGWRGDRGGSSRLTDGPALAYDGRMDVAEAVVAAGRRLGERGLIVAAEGNLSVRLDETSLLITPAGRRKDELSPTDLVRMPMEPAGSGPPASGPRPSSDLAIHRAVYAVRPDVGSIVHAHLPASLALTLAGEVPDPSVLPETALLLRRLPFVPFAPAGSEELARRIAEALSEGRPPAGAVLLERHGAVAVGDWLDQAMDRIEVVDLLCRVWRDARALGFRAVR